MAKRWMRRPPGSNWGEYGEDDQLGRLNLITPEKVRQGIAEVQEGLRFCLSMPLDLPGGNVLNVRRGPPQLDATYKDGDPYINFPFARLGEGQTDVVSDDRVILHPQYSTQWDSLAHVGSLFDADGDGVEEAVYYNGFRANAEIRGPRNYLAAGKENGSPGPYGAHALAVDNLASPPVQGRAVLVNLVAAYGRERRLIGARELQDAIERQGVRVGEGDILLLYTGFADALVEMAGEPIPETLKHTGAELDGRDQALLQWISDTGIAAIAADNTAVEAYPHPQGPIPGAAMPLHEHCLFKLGIPLGELWWLSDLADWLQARDRSSFLLTAPALRLPRAFGSPLTPVATV
jgi:hypothetical protein